MCLNAGCTGKKSAAEEPELTYSNPLSVQFGDPYVLLASDGRYYMYGTGAGAVDGYVLQRGLAEESDQRGGKFPYRRSCVG